MELLDRVRRWLKLKHGLGKKMQKDGAELMACPHCDRDTPVFQSEYDQARNPISFTTCLWCDGYIEWKEYEETPRIPYTSTKEVETKK